MHMDMHLSSLTYYEFNLSVKCHPYAILGLVGVCVGMSSIWSRIWEAMHRQAEEFLGKMRGRFHWVYLIVGLTILTFAGMSWLLETDDTYWIWHM
jgi:hypothetical protein